MAKKDDDNELTMEDRLILAIEMLARRDASPRNDDLMERLTLALDRVAANQLEGSKLVARAQRPSNEVVPMRSVFNPRGETLEGYTKPKLKCAIVLLPWQAENESMTREEIELVNLLQPGHYVVKRIDSSKIKMSIQAEYDVDGIKMTKLLLNHETAFNNDNFRLMPALPDYLRQILKQHADVAVQKAAREVMSMEEEEALIEAGDLSVAV